MQSLLIPMKLVLKYPTYIGNVVSDPVDFENSENFVQMQILLVTSFLNTASLSMILYF